MGKNPTLSRFATAILGVNIGVILWGAFVRATGSGAGCGSHWPLCNGEIIPRSESLETLIEFIHRGTSGIALLGVVVLTVWAWRTYSTNTAVRFGASLSLVFIITEAIVGAGLVLFELVDENDSVARAITIAIHLLNTFLLLAFLALTAWWASGRNPPSLRANNLEMWLLILGILGMLLLGMSGSLAALGDTLFPASSLREGIQQDFSPTAHSLIRLRVLHPTIAIAVSSYLVILSSWLNNRRFHQETRVIGRILQTFIFVQFLAGFMNLFLLAPVWMQIIHLFLADVVWVALILFASNTLQGEREESIAANESIKTIYTESS
jgi:heme A synthase